MARRTGSPTSCSGGPTCHWTRSSTTCTTSTPCSIIFHIPPNLVVGRCRRTLIASGSEDLQVEHPVCGGYAPAFHLHPTLPGMLGAPLIRDQVVQVGQPREKRLLAAPWVMKAFHGEQFPLESVMGLIEHRARYRHLGVCEHRIPPRLLVLHPAPHTFPVGRPSHGGDVVSEV